MKWVSYTRSISSRIGEENPANTIAEQNANIEQYLKDKGYRISEKYSDRKRSAEAADGFDRMVQDGMTQKFDAVAVDSIFRFGKTLPFAINGLLQRTPMKQSLQKMSIIRHKRQSAMLLRSSIKPKMILL